MNRRELLKRAAIVPLAALGAGIAAPPAEAAVALIGTIYDVYPGGTNGVPESQNGGDIVFKFHLDDIKGEDAGEPRFALGQKKTDYFVRRQSDGKKIKVKYREFLNAVYLDHANLLAALLGRQIIATYKGNQPYGIASIIDIDVVLAPG